MNRVSALLLLLVLAAPVPAAARSIDFSVYPDGSPTAADDPIADQYVPWGMQIGRASCRERV